MHVLRNAHRVEIRTLDGKGRTYPVRGAFAIDDEADLALLSVDLPAERSRPLPLSTTLPEEGEQVFVIGNPLRLEGSISDGIVSAVREVPALGRIIQITAPVSHGNSGSPLFNMRGQVIGIVTVKVTNGQNINLALGAARVASLQPGPLVSFDQVGSRNRSNQPRRWPIFGIAVGSIRCGWEITRTRSTISRPPRIGIPDAWKRGFRLATAK